MLSYPTGFYSMKRPELDRLALITGLVTVDNTLGSLPKVSKLQEPHLSKDKIVPLSYTMGLWEGSAQVRCVNDASTNACCIVDVQ